MYFSIGGGFNMYFSIEEGFKMYYSREREGFVPEMEVAASHTHRVGRTRTAEWWSSIALRKVIVNKTRPKKAATANHRRATNRRLMEPSRLPWDE